MNDHVDKDPPSRLYPSVGSLFTKLVIAVSMIPLALFIFSLLGRYFFFAELFGNFRCQIMALLIPSVFLLAVLRRWLLSAAVAVALIWSMMGIVWIYIPRHQPPPGPESLRVMSFNVLVQNTQHTAVVSRILDVDPDVVTILEYSGQWHSILQCLDRRYPYSVKLPRWHGFGIAIFSKYPLTDTQVIGLTKEKTDNPMIVSRVKFGEQTIRLAGLHVLSPTNRFRLDLRNQQFIEAAAALGGDQVATVIMGDFNCTPWSPFLNDFLVETGYRDSRQGFGYQASWHVNYWPLQIPIDHAFVSSNVHVHSRRVEQSAGSDHFPIVFEISTAE